MQPSKQPISMHRKGWGVQSLKEIKMPKLGLTMEQAEIVTWDKNPGDFVEKNEVLLSVETDKAVLEVESEESGYLFEQCYQIGDSVQVGDVVAKYSDEPMEDSAENASQQSGAPETSDETATNSESTTKSSTKDTVIRKSAMTELMRIPASPAVRRIARRQGIDLSTIEGSGPNGRIIMRDLKRSESQKEDLSTETVPQAEKVKMTAMRKAISARMCASVQEIPQFQIKCAVDMSKVIDLRTLLIEKTEMPVKITLTDFIVQAIATALMEMPQVNTSFLAEAGESYIVKNKEVNVGLAVALKEGLIVPVVKRVNELTLWEIAAERSRLIERAKSGQLKPEEYSGGGFTLSNLGGYDVDEFTALINPPESGILAIGKIKDIPIAHHGELAIRPILNMVGSFDHRVLDGADGAAFMQTIKAILEADKWKVSGGIAR